MSLLNLMYLSMTKSAKPDYIQRFFVSLMVVPMRFARFITRITLAWSDKFANSYRIMKSHPSTLLFSATLTDISKRVSSNVFSILYFAMCKNFCSKFWVRTIPSSSSSILFPVHVFSMCRYPTQSLLYFFLAMFLIGGPFTVNSFFIVEYAQFPSVSW